MKKIIKKITAMAVMSLLAATQLQTPQVNVQAADGVATSEKTTTKQPKIYGRSGIVIDAKSGKILYAKKVDDRHYPASITKILTTLVAIENNKDLYDEVTFSSYAVNSIEPGSTHIGIKAGEKIPLIDVLNAIMLESANEACNGAAEHTAGASRQRSGRAGGAAPGGGNAAAPLADGDGVACGRRGDASFTQAHGYAAGG